MNGHGSDMRLVWAGPLQPDRSLLQGSAPHPATMRWQRTYIGGLREAGVRVHWVGHDPHRTWPWGPALVSHRADDVDVDATAVPHANIPYARLPSLRWAYRRRLVAAVEACQAQAIVTYNADPWSSAAADAAETCGVPWVPIVLDFDDPRPDGWAAFRRAVARAAGVAFVSHWAFLHAPCREKMLIRGAVLPRSSAPVSPRSARGGRTILYAGARARHAGVDRLIASMGLLQTPDVRLIMTGQGKGYDREIAGATAADDRITDLGMVTEDELCRLAAAADVLVNPRPISAENSCMNFPSKILDYLSHGRPIVSTRSVGLGPDYDDVMVFTEGDEPRHLAAAIDAVLAWPADERAAAAKRCRIFVQRHSPLEAGKELASWLRART